MEVDPSSLVAALSRLNDNLTQLSAILENRAVTVHSDSVAPVNLVEQSVLTNSDEEDLELERRQARGAELRQWLDDCLPTDDRLGKIREGFIGHLFNHREGGGLSKTINLWKMLNLYLFLECKIRLDIEGRSPGDYETFDCEETRKWGDGRKSLAISRIRRIWLTNFGNSLLWNLTAFPKIPIPIKPFYYFSDSSGYPTIHSAIDELPELHRDYHSVGRVCVATTKGQHDTVLDFSTFGILNGLLSDSAFPASSPVFLLSYTSLQGFSIGTSAVSWNKEISNLLTLKFGLTYCDNAEISKPTISEGYMFSRQKVQIRRPGMDLMWLEERRSAVSMTLTQLPSTSAYTLVIIGDDEHVYWADKAFMDDHGLLPCGKATGICQFLAAVLCLLEKWEEKWNQSLDLIDKSIRVNLSDSMDDAAMEKLMFDDSFELSKYYFTLLQLLRISSEWIDEAVGSFKALKTALIDRRSKSPMMVPNESEWHKVLKNCDIVSLVLEESAGEIKSRVNRKTEEVKSLRDGLFNATSLREATKGMALNRAIYVFTVVTVVYAPIGFLAAFWALPFVNNTLISGASVDTPAAFTITFIMIPLLTYIPCIAVVAYFNSAVFRQLCKTAWTQTKKYFSEILGKLGLGTAMAPEYSGESGKSFDLEHLGDVQEERSARITDI